MAITGKKPSEWSAATITAVKEVLSLNSANYVSVDVGVDAKANGAALIAAYTAAKALTPNGAALATDNRACVIIPPANYDLDHGTENACVPLVLDTEFVDIIGLTTDAFSQFIYGTPDITTTGIIMQTADDVHISNIKAKCDITQELFLSIIMEGGTPNMANIVHVPSSYFPATGLSKSVVDNCIFQEGSATLEIGEGVVIPIGFSMRIGVLEYSGTFTSCTGGEVAFGGYGGTASGTFNNCTGGAYSFCGGNGTASGTFTSCTGGYGAFARDGIASGTFTNCTGGEGAFGGNGTASGTFTNCTGEDWSFGGYSVGIASGTFTNCTGGEGAFGGNGTASGTFKDCTGGNGAFGSGGTASGTFKDCTGGEGAFGGNGTASGTFKDCTGGNGAFGSGGTASGTFKDCTGGYGAFGGYGTASGKFTNCTGEDWSFGGYGTASGTFTNCTGEEGAFGGYGTASGTFTNCTGEEGAFGGYGVGIASGTFTNCTGGEGPFGSNGTASGTFSFCKQPTAFGTLKCTVATVEITSGGTLYEIDDELTVVGGTGDAATLKVTSVTDGVIDGIQVLTVGNYTALPSNPVATTGHTEDATFNLTWKEGHIYGCVDSTGFIAEKNWDD